MYFDFIITSNRCFLGASTLQQLTILFPIQVTLSNKSLQWNNSLLLFPIGATKKLGGYNIKNLSYLNLDYFVSLINLRNFKNLDL